MLAVAGCRGKDKASDKESSSERSEGDVDPAKSKAEELDEAIPVEVARINQGDIAETLYATATVQSQRQVVLLAEAAGRVVSIEPEQGDTIEKAGAVVGRIENAELALAVESSKAQVKRTRAELARLEPLLEKGYIPRVDYERTRTELEIAESELKRSQTFASNARIRSPIAGVVAIRHVEVGTQVLPNQPLLTLIDPDALEVLIQVPERELGRLALEQPAFVSSEALGEHRFSAHVEAIAPTVDPTSGTIGVTVALDNHVTPEGRRLRPGMFVSVDVEVERREGVPLTPKRSLIYDEGQPRLFVVRDGHAKLIAVKVGAAEGDKVEITEGAVNAGDDVIVLGQTHLKDNASVRVVRRNGKSIAPAADAGP